MTSSQLMRDKARIWDNGVVYRELSGKIVIATGGVFDLLHVGHLDQLRFAARLREAPNTFLAVLVNSDISVCELKGEQRPIVPQEHRVEMLRALDLPIDAIILFDDPTPTRILRMLQPDVWIKGEDWAGKALPEESVLHEGCHIVFLKRRRPISTTVLINRAWMAYEYPKEKKDGKTVPKSD